MASVSRGQGLSDAVGDLAHGITLWSMSQCQDVNIFWNSVGDSDW